MPGTSPDSLDAPTSSLTLASDPAAVRQARLFVRNACRAYRMPETVSDTAILLTSEVVTNALTHGRSEARLSVTFVGTAIRIEVTDENSRHPQPAAVDEDALNGRGLMILDLLAKRWGVRDEIYGKTVWFDVDIHTR